MIIIDNNKKKLVHVVLVCFRAIFGINHHRDFLKF